MVLVQGKQFLEKIRKNQVDQRTVLGPPLWIIHFADVSVPASEGGFREKKFAGDLSCDKVMDRHVPDDEIFKDLASCHDRVHKWGVQNRVQFDSSKEEMIILHTQRCAGDAFKFVGPMIDTKLVMDVETERL